MLLVEVAERVNAISTDGAFDLIAVNIEFWSIDHPNVLDAVIGSGRYSRGPSCYK
jgi:hypothetical protein